MKQAQIQTSYHCISVNILSKWVVFRESIPKTIPEGAFPGPNPPITTKHSRLQHSFYQKKAANFPGSMPGKERGYLPSWTEMFPFWVHSSMGIVSQCFKQLKGSNSVQKGRRRFLPKTNIYKTTPKFACEFVYVCETLYCISCPWFLLCFIGITYAESSGFQVSVFRSY